jgi:hypothetical protein
MVQLTCGYCGRPGSTWVFLNTRPYHEECTHGPGWRPQCYGSSQPALALSEDGIRQIIREEIEHLKDEIERGLGVRP